MILTIMRLSAVALLILLLIPACSENGTDGIDPSTFTLSVVPQPCQGLTFLANNDPAYFRVQTSAEIPQIDLVERQECPLLNEEDPISYCGDTPLGTINLSAGDNIISSEEIRAVLRGNEFGRFHWRARIGNDIFFYSENSYNYDDLRCDGCALLPELSTYSLPNEQACSTASAEPFRTILTELYGYVGSNINNLAFLACDRARLTQEQSSIPADLSAYDGLLIFNRPADDTIQLDASKPFVLATLIYDEGGRSLSTTVMPESNRNNIMAAHIHQYSGGSGISLPNLIPGDVAYLKNCNSGGSLFTVNGQNIYGVTTYTVPTP